MLLLSLQTFIEINVHSIDIKLLIGMVPNNDNIEDKTFKELTQIEIRTWTSRVTRGKTIQKCETKMQKKVSFCEFK